VLERGVVALAVRLRVQVLHGGDGDTVMRKCGCGRLPTKCNRNKKPSRRAEKTRSSPLAAAQPSILDEIQS